VEAVEKNSSQLEQVPKLCVSLLGREVPESSPCSSFSLQKSVSAQYLHCVSDMMSSLLFFPHLQMETRQLGPGEADSHWLLGSEN